MGRAARCASSVSPASCRRDRAPSRYRSRHGFTVRAAHARRASRSRSASLWTACQPLYGGKPEKLKNAGEEEEAARGAEAAVEIKYVEDCNANFSDDPKKAHPQPPQSRPSCSATARPRSTESDKAKEDSMKVSLIKEAIDKYRNALIKDPYNVPATLKLAVAYDRVLRKGCAIAMLKRLAALSGNPKWASEANRNIDSIDATTRNGSRATARKRWPRWDADASNTHCSACRSRRRARRPVTQKQELTAAAAAAAPRARAEARSDGRRRTASRPIPQHELKPISFDQRSIPEGMRLADQAHAKLNGRRERRGRSPDARAVLRPTRSMTSSPRSRPTRTTSRRRTASPPPTRRSAGKQCSINLLTRMLQMRTAPEQAAPRSRPVIDRCSAASRRSIPTSPTCAATSRFRELIAKMCEGTNDAELRLRRASKTTASASQRLRAAPQAA